MLINKVPGPVEMRTRIIWKALDKIAGPAGPTPQVFRQQPFRNEIPALCEINIMVLRDQEEGAGSNCRDCSCQTSGKTTKWHRIRFGQKRGEHKPHRTAYREAANMGAVIHLAA